VDGGKRLTSYLEKNSELEYLLDMRLGGPQGHLDVSKRRKISASCWDLNLDQPASSLDIIPTAPLQILSIYNSNLKQGTKKTCPSQVANYLFLTN